MIEYPRRTVEDWIDKAAKLAELEKMIREGKAKVVPNVPAR